MIGCLSDPIYRGWAHAHLKALKIWGPVPPTILPTDKQAIPSLVRLIEVIGASRRRPSHVLGVG